MEPGCFRGRGGGLQWAIAAGNFYWWRPRTRCDQPPLWDRSSMRLPSASGRPRPTIAPCQATGKETLLSGANNTHIATLVERHTRFVVLLKVPSKDTATVVAALGKHVRKLPQELRRSLTWDRGKEMADHKNFTVATNVRSISAIHAVLGSAAATRTPTACCDSISRGEQISRASLRRT